jgi:hypothetical protein
MSLIAVQAGIGGHVLRTDVAAAENAFEIIAETSRSALTQTRSMLGLLREENADATSPPVRTMRDLDAPAQDVSAAGVRVALTVDSTTRPLDTGVELTAVPRDPGVTDQRAHALRCPRASVSVVCSSDTLDIEVRHPGSATRPRPLSSAEPSGHGLAGLHRTRSTSRRHAGVRGVDDTGFRVSAHLPAPAPETS